MKVRLSVKFECTNECWVDRQPVTSHVAVYGDEEMELPRYVYHQTRNSIRSGRMPSHFKKNKRQITGFTIRKAGFFSNQPPFFQVRFIRNFNVILS